MFLESSTGLVTRRCYDILKQIDIVQYYVGFGSTRRSVIASIPLPDESLENQTAARETALKIHQVFEAYFDTNFPMYELTNSYACLDLESSISWGERQTLLRALALHESVPPDDCW